MDKISNSEMASINQGDVYEYLHKWFQRKQIHPNGS